VGSEGLLYHEYAQTVDICSIFKHNMIALRIWDIVCLFADGIVDLVFVDAGHRYERRQKKIFCLSMPNSGKMVYSADMIAKGIIHIIPKERGQRLSLVLYQNGTSSTC
jgi:hypothetical protein